MFQLSAKSLPGNSHPIVLLLFPNPKPGGHPQAGRQGQSHLGAELQGRPREPKGTLGLGLTIFGASESE